MNKLKYSPDWWSSLIIFEFFLPIFGDILWAAFIILVILDEKLLDLMTGGGPVGEEVIIPCRIVKYSHFGNITLACEFRERMQKKVDWCLLMHY